MVDPLRRVLVRRPSVAACSLWEEYGWRAAPDSAALLREHEAFCAILEGAGCDVVVADAMDTDLDSVYVFDPAIVTEQGAILMWPGKAGRRAEPLAVVRELEPAGVPVAAVVDEPAVAEGGDFIRLDETTLLVGRGYRPSLAGIEAVAQALPGVEALTFDLPYWHGETEVMHLLSLLSPLDADLVVAYPPLLPVALAQLLAEREIEIVPVPDDEFESMGTNVLALAPRVALAIEGNPVTRDRLVAAGVEVLVYEGRELSLKGDGGPTCLTMPLLRG
jgi:dimethylargininase